MLLRPAAGLFALFFAVYIADFTSAGLRRLLLLMQNMKIAILLLLSLILSLVEVHSQTAPYVSFMGDILPNHAYVDLTTVVEDIGDPGNTVRCHTDIFTCCTGSQGIHTGDWYFPYGPALFGSSSGGDIYMHRGFRVVYLRRRNNPTLQTGIYHCEIPTVAVNDNTNTNMGETVYVGLFLPNQGNITIPDGVTLSVNTLTCISTGGPATTVTWTRDSVTITEGTAMVLNDPETAQYTHTLTVTSAGEYTCTVANNKPSIASANITLQVTSPPTNVSAVQDGPTSIRVSWTPPTPLGDTTGYRISYTGGGSSDSVDTDGGSTDEYTLSDLQNGETYNVSIIATSQHLPSDTVVLELTLSQPGPPEQPNVNVTSISVTSITISWNTPNGSVVTHSQVVWSVTSGIEGTSGNLTETSNYTIEQLDSNTIYNITVTVSNIAGSTNSQPIIVSTGQTKEEYCTADSERDNTTAIIITSAVVVALVFIIPSVAIIIVCSVLWNCRRAHKATNPQKREIVDIPLVSTHRGIELPPEPTPTDSNTVITTGNEAYNASSVIIGSNEAEYETISSSDVPPFTSQSPTSQSSMTVVYY